MTSSRGRIRVVHLITDLEVGGAEAMLLKVVSTFDRARFDTSVVSVMPCGAIGAAIAAAGIPVESLDVPRGQADPRGFFALWRRFLELRPDVVQTWLYHADLLGTAAAAVARVPHVVWNLRASEIRPADFSRGFAVVLRLLALASPRPDAIVVNSLAGREAHEKIGYRPRRWVHIPNGFNLETFAPSEEARESVRRELGLESDTPLVGLVARYDPMKDHATFFRAAALLHRQQPGVHFLLAGRGVDEGNATIRGALADGGLLRVTHLLGERADVPRLTAALDVASSTSYTEGFPNAIGEAMACGVPCVVTDVGDSARIVDDTGRIVPAADALAIARAWRELLELPREARRALGAAARERVGQEFSLDAVARAYENLYLELTGAPAGA